MRPINEHDGMVEIEQGQYWRALVDIKNEKIEKDTVLLLESIRDVDNQPHTIILRAHPSRMREYGPKEHRFLVADFLRKFELEPDYVRIRQQELERIQGLIGELQEELAEAEVSTPPSLRRSLESGVQDWEKQKQLPAGTAQVLAQTGVALDVTPSLQAEQVDNMKLTLEHRQKIATIKAEWIKEKVGQIGETVAAMTPFFQEKAAAALAKTEDVCRYVARLQSGIQSLDLYVGTNVSKTTLREGAPAPSNIPLTIMQCKLYADEELSVFADVDEKFDHSSIEVFFKALGERPGLVNQIFPTERSIVAYAATRRRIDYNDIWANDIRNQLNRQVGLLVRNGDNIHVVISPIDTHLAAHNLFPSRKELDDIFRESVGFWEEREGKQGREINFNDVRYTDKLTEHEAFALHYKRFMILLAGLDHREKLFGEFYEGPQNMDFISLPFQQRNFRFIHDEDGDMMLPEVKHPSLQDWIASKNSYLRSGSRVLGLWTTAMTSRTAPGAVDPARGNDRYEFFKARPIEDISVEIAFQSGREIFVSVPVKRTSYSSDQEFGARVSLTKYRDSSIGYLVLDNVKADEMEYYIHSRRERVDHLEYIQFFKRAVKFLREEEAKEAASRDRLRRALVEGAIASGAKADALIDQAVIAWRAENRGADLPTFTSGSDPAWISLLNHMYTQIRATKHAANAELWAKNEGLTPLRLVVTGKNKLRLYCAPNADERDDRLTPHIWVHAVDFTTRKTSDLKKTGQKWEELPKSKASETTLREWPEAEAWAGLESPISFQQKQSIFEQVKQFDDVLAHHRDPQKYEELFETWTAVRRELNRKSSSVRNPILAIPFGVGYHTKGHPAKGRYFFICLTHDHPEKLLAKLTSNEEGEKAIRDLYIRTYANKQAARDRFDEALADEWAFGEIEVTKYEGALNHTYLESLPVGSSRVTDSLNDWLKRAKERWAIDRSGDSSVVVLDDRDFDTMLGIDSRFKQFQVDVAWGTGATLGVPITLWSIYPVDEYGEVKTKLNDKWKMKAFQGGYSSTSRGYFFTLEEAREFLLTAAQPCTDPAVVPPDPSIECWFAEGTVDKRF